MNTLTLSRDLFPLIGQILCETRRIQNTLQEDCAIASWKIHSVTYYHLFFTLKLGTKILVNN